MNEENEKIPEKRQKNSCTEMRKSKLIKEWKKIEISKKEAKRIRTVLK